MFSLQAIVSCSTPPAPCLPLSVLSPSMSLLLGSLYSTDNHSNARKHRQCVICKGDVCKANALPGKGGCLIMSWDAEKHRQEQQKRARLCWKGKHGRGGAAQHAYTSMQPLSGPSQHVEQHKDLLPKRPSKCMRTTPEYDGNQLDDPHRRCGGRRPSP